METLYVIGMIAIFVLCVALLSTARRTSRSSPLSSVQLDLSRIYDVERTEEEALTEMSSAKMTMPDIDAGYTGWSPLIIDEPVVNRPAMAETQMSEAVSERAIIAEPVLAASMPPMTPYLTEIPTDNNPTERPRTNRWLRLHKPSRRTYNYALECLLIGVSAWV